MMSLIRCSVVFSAAMAFSISDFRFVSGVLDDDAKGVKPLFRELFFTPSSTLHTAFVLGSRLAQLALCNGSFLGRPAQILFPPSGPKPRLPPRPRISPGASSATTWPTPRQRSTPGPLHSAPPGSPGTGLLGQYLPAGQNHPAGFASTDWPGSPSGAYWSCRFR